MFWLILLVIVGMAAITAAAVAGCVAVFTVVMFVADPIYLRVKRSKLPVIPASTPFDLMKTGQYKSIDERKPPPK